MSYAGIQSHRRLLGRNSFGYQCRLRIKWFVQQRWL